MDSNLERDWRFTRSITEGFEQPDFDDSAWESVDVPHDWAIRGPFSPQNDAEITVLDAAGNRSYHYTLPGRTGGLPHVGKGFYRKRFLMGEKLPGHVRVEFDGIMANSKVYCNGKYAGGRPYGYSSFAVDLTDLVHPGENVLAVEAENYPQASRWYPGGGIYRHVRLVTAGRVHIDHWGVRIRTEGGSVRVTVRVHNPEKETAHLRISVSAPDGSPAFGGTMEGTTDFSSAFRIENPSFWHPDTPHLYRLVLELGEEKREIRFGLRDTVFDPVRGFLINGTPLKFRGVCLHHDLGPLGAAVNRDATRHRLLQLKGIGCNAIRTSHNPPDPELLDLCDELGFLVLCEAFDEWKLPKCPNGYNLYFDEWSERDLRDMIRRDANHPSVIMWSIGNEIDEQYVPEGPEMTRRLCAICHDEDPTRPTTAGLNNGDDSIRGGLFDDVDVKGFNYKPYIYSVYHHNFPDAPIYSSESASTLSSRGEYSDRFFEELERKDNLQVDSFDLCCSAGGTVPDHEFKGQDDNPFVMGEFVWTGFDYLGEPTPYQNKWPSRSSYYGIFDLCGIPKDRAYLYRSRWTSRSVLHLMPHWTWPGREGNILPVQCYTSFDRVELFVNGVSQGVRVKNPKKLLGRYRLVWNSVRYEPGELRAKALDRNGNVLMESVVRTAGEPDHLVGEAERCGDLVFVTVSVVDRSGVLCPDAGDRISFESPSVILAADAGDPTSTKEFHLPYVNAFHGKCAAVLRSSGKTELSARAFLGGRETVLELRDI